MTVSATLDKTVRLYRANFKPLLLISALVGVPQVPLAVMTAAALEEGEKSGPVGALLAGGAPMRIVGAALLASFLLTPLYYGAMSSGALGAVRGQTISVRAAFRAAFACYFSTLGAGLLIVLCSGVTLLLLIFPGVFVFLGFSFTVLVLLDERLGAIAAMRRSWALADGQRGLLFWMFFAWGILQVVLSYGFSSLLRMFGLDAMAGPLAQEISQILIVPCHGLSLTLILEEIRTAREGRDLVLEAQRLAEATGGAAVASPQPPATL